MSILVLNLRKIQCALLRLHSFLAAMRIQRKITICSVDIKYTGNIYYCYILKEENLMKTMIRKFGPILATVALLITTISVNTACSWVGYQPKLPPNANKLRKF